MHSYSIGGDKSSLRRKVVIWLFCISVVLYTLEMHLVDWITANFTTAFTGVNNFFSNLPWLGVSLSGLSAFAIFGVLFWLFDKHIWKLKFMQKLTEIPDFSGVWVGNLKSSYEESPEIDVSMAIKQTWNNVSIVTTFPESQSWSDSAHIAVHISRGPLLKFTYANRGDNKDWEVREHRGENEMFLQKQDEKTKQYNLLRGDYYNNRGKSGNVGSIILRRKGSTEDTP